MARIPMRLPGVAVTAKVPAAQVDDYKSRGWQEVGKSKASKKPADDKTEKPASGDKKSKSSKKPADDNKSK